MTKRTLAGKLKNTFLTGLTAASLGAATLFYGCDSPTSSKPVPEENPVKPVAEFVAEPVEGCVPLEVSFDASRSYDPDGSIEKYVWDFGDGKKDSVSEALVNYTYQSPGEYDPSLTVADNSGMRSEKKTLEGKISAGELIGQIAFMGERENYRFHIFLGDLVEGTLTNIQNLTTYDPNSVAGLPDDYRPAWSPDGKKIVFTSNRDGDTALYTMDADGSNQTRLTKKGYANWPDWSPDGDKILYSYINQADSLGGIAFMSLDDGEITRLIEVPCFGSCSIPNSVDWSPDGQQIVYHTKRDGNWEIYTMDSEGENQVNITNNLAEDMEPAWSPDGKKIVFTSNRDGDTALYTMDADGSNPIKLTDDSGSDLVADWSPDGTKIIFQRDTNIFVIDADGNNPAKITSGSTPAWRPKQE